MLNNNFSMILAGNSLSHKLFMKTKLVIQVLLEISTYEKDAETFAKDSGGFAKSVEEILNAGKQYEQINVTIVRAEESELGMS